MLQDTAKGSTFSKVANILDLIHEDAAIFMDKLTQTSDWNLKSYKLETSKEHVEKTSETKTKLTIN